MGTEASRGISGGTGAQLTKATIIVAGVCSLVSTLISIASIFLQLKNYRKPLLQRYVVRILVMVPIYAVASWSSLVSLRVAFYVDPIKEIYEAFTIYTFFGLLINYIGGERALLILMHGRKPTPHLWPLNYVLPTVDISDPYTFLAIKRGILQYAYIKPLLAVASIIMKATGTYQEGYLGLTSGYLWSGLIYNASVTVSLYSLGMFWVCMSEDLKPFRPVPKFLCIKLLIFASYWQGFFLSILVWLGAIPDNVEGYSPDNIAAAIQDALICCELIAFAVGHWYAFSWRDYDDRSISSARMTIKHAFRDSFGIRDLIEDTRETFMGKKYDYRAFDSGDNVLAHEESTSRDARLLDGMRYQRGGKGKYWIPPPSAATSRTPLLAGTAGPIGPLEPLEHTREDTEESLDDKPLEINEDDERLYDNARALEFGDWNYPVVTAHQPSARDRLRQPDNLTTATNRRLLKPAEDTDAVKAAKDHKGKKTASPTRPSGPRSESSLSTESTHSRRSQLIDLVVEDYEGEEIERIRARKEGGSHLNDPDNPPRRFIKTYPSSEEGEEEREGFDEEAQTPPASAKRPETTADEHANAWDSPQQRRDVSYGDLGEDDVWKDH